MFSVKQNQMRRIIRPVFDARLPLIGPNIENVNVSSGPITWWASCYISCYVSVYTVDLAYLRTANDAESTENDQGTHDQGIRYEREMTTQSHYVTTKLESLNYILSGMSVRKISGIFPRKIKKTHKYRWRLSLWDDQIFTRSWKLCSSVALLWSMNRNWEWKF